MIHGLRWRLTVAIVLITLAASTIVGLGLGRFTRTEFENFLEVEAEGPRVEFPDPAALIARLASDDLDGARTELGVLGDRLDGARLLLFASDGALLADTAPEGEVVLHDDGRLEVVGSRETDGVRREERMMLRGGLELDAAGERLGSLFVLPTASADELRPAHLPAAGFSRAISRAHLIGIAIATGIALVIALVLSGRIVGPVETLTRAARRLAQGDLSQRVAADSRDEIGELAKAFNAMAESLERQETVRRNMVSDVAHELRTPLTHLRCKLESVQDGLASADADLVTDLHGEIVHLGRLVDDLQELALAEAGRLPLFPTEVDLAPIARQLVTALPTKAGATVAVEIAADLAPVTIDVDRFRQVLRNLLQNALRHGSSNGHIVVRVHDEKPGAGRQGRTVRCEVCDDGPGISADHLERVFDRFHRTDPSRDRATGGAGLGLAIARQLVLAWNGTIGVESQSGHGATFWFTIPVGGTAGRS